MRRSGTPIEQEPAKEAIFNRIWSAAQVDLPEIDFEAYTEKIQETEPNIVSK